MSFHDSPLTEVDKPGAAVYMHKQGEIQRAAVWRAFIA